MQTQSGPVSFLYIPPLPSRHQTFLQLLHTLQGQLPFPEAETELPQRLDLPEDKPQKQNPGDTIGKDRSGPSKVNERLARGQGGRERSWEVGLTHPPYHVSVPKGDGPQPAGDASSPGLPEGQQHGKGT